MDLIWGRASLIRTIFIVAAPFLPLYIPVRLSQEYHSEQPQCNYVMVWNFYGFLSGYKIFCKPPHFGREYASCILTEGPYVYSSRRPLTLCGPVVHLVSRGRRPHRCLVMQMAKSKKNISGVGPCKLVCVFVFACVCVCACMCVSV